MLFKRFSIIGFRNQRYNGKDITSRRNGLGIISVIVLLSIGLSVAQQHICRLKHLQEKSNPPIASNIIFTSSGLYKSTNAPLNNLRNSGLGDELKDTH